MGIERDDELYTTLRCAQATNRQRGRSTAATGTRLGQYRLVVPRCVRGPRGLVGGGGATERKTACGGTTRAACPNTRRTVRQTQADRVRAGDWGARAPWASWAGGSPRTTRTTRAAARPCSPSSRRPSHPARPAGKRRRRWRGAAAANDRLPWRHQARSLRAQPSAQPRRAQPSRCSRRAAAAMPAGARPPATGSRACLAAAARAPMVGWASSHLPAPHPRRRTPRASARPRSPAACGAPPPSHPASPPGRRPRAGCQASRQRASALPAAARSGR